MTNTIYTLPTIKKEPSTIDAPEYMDINSDEAEAGSILMSLSQQPKRSERSATMNTMSIRNLLEDNNEHTTSRQEQAKMNGLTFADSTRPPIARQYPEAAKEVTQTYATGMHGYHSTSTALPEISASMEYTAQRQPESYDWQHEQQPSHNGQHYQYHHQERYQQHPNRHHHHHQEQQHQHQSQHQPQHQSQQSHQSQQHQYQYQQHQQHQQHQHRQYQHQHQQPIKKPYTRYDSQQQSYQSMRKHPKIRRNALHAYISYMTYTDLKRIKSDATQLQQPYGTQLMTKQNTYSSSTPLLKHPSEPTLSSTQQQQHQRRHHHQPPLTAFLKDTIDSTLPSTPIPTSSSLPPIESRRPFNNWPDQNYQSSSSPPQLRYPYPAPSSSTK